MLLNSDVPNFFMKRKRRKELVKRKPSQLSRTMKATMIPRVKKAFQTFREGGVLEASSVGFLAREDFLALKRRSEPKKIKRAAKILGNSDGPG